MTKQSLSLFFILFTFLGTHAVIGQNNTYYDDLYFDGEEETSTYNNHNAATSEHAVYEDEMSTTESIRENTRSYERYAQNNGSADPYAYQYASRIRRFHNPASGFSYYSNYYVDNYWYDPYASNFYGTSIYIVGGWSNDPWNRWRPYNRWQTTWAWNNGFYRRNPYCGWNSGWNTTYYNTPNYVRYNYVASTPNAASYTNSIRGLRGASSTRVNGQHVASSPRGRSTSTTSIPATQSNRSNGRSNTSTTERTHVTTTTVRARTPHVSSSTRQDYTPSSRSNSSRSTYTPSSRSNSSRSTYTPSSRSNSSRSTYTPSSRSNSSRSTSTSSSSRSTNTRSSHSSSSSRRGGRR